ncbi:hypothetical protein ALC53_08829, partial [Atta colombica]
ELLLLCPKSDDSTTINSQRLKSNVAHNIIFMAHIKQRYCDLERTTDKVRLRAQVAMQNYY